jgi:multiple sugar transport system ATP-binding protein
VAPITLERLSKVYGDGTKAVCDLDLRIGDGEFVVLVGPSGCGKTTALRMVAGLEEITSGEVRVGDRVVNDLPPKDRDIAMVFQNYALYPHMTAYDNIAFGLKMRDVSRAEIDRRVTDASRALGLDEVLRKKPRTLSGGQRQRVAMGRAIVREPQAFLMDEPLSNLDAKLRVEMRAEITRIQRDLKVTTMYVTHDQTEAMTLGDRVAVLKRGVLQQLATPRELYNGPVNLFVAGFIGSPPMNFLPATVNGTEVELPFGTVTLSHQKAQQVQGKDLLIAGIRPEHFNDAAVVDSSIRGHGSTFRATVDVVEWLGHEAYAYIPFEAPPEVSEQLAQLERDLDGETLRTQLVVSLDANSRIVKGEEAEIWVDPEQMHLFDPATGDNLTLV